MARCPRPEPLQTCTHTATTRLSPASSAISCQNSRKLGALQAVRCCSDLEAIGVRTCVTCPERAFPCGTDIKECLPHDCCSFSPHDAQPCRALLDGNSTPVVKVLLCDLQATNVALPAALYDFLRPCWHHTLLHLQSWDVL